jgi:hypothetical protein
VSAAQRGAQLLALLATGLLGGFRTRRLTCPSNTEYSWSTEELTILHLAEEKLRDGAVIHVTGPTTLLHGRPVTVYSVLTHPTDGRPRIAYGRGSAFGTGAEGRTDFPTKGASMSMQQQGGAQEPEAPEAPMREEPEQMPEEPGIAPEAPTMPEDPDRDPSQRPPDESATARQAR